MTPVPPADVPSFPSLRSPQRFSQLFTPLTFTLALLMILVARPAVAVDMDVLIGFGQSTTSTARYRPETWTPLTVYLTGQGARGVGQLQVSVNTGERSTLYTRRISLPDGALNEVQSFVLRLPSPNPNMMFRSSNGAAAEISVQLLMDGHQLAEKKAPLPLALQPEAYNVLALTRDGSGMNFLLKKKLGLVHRHLNPGVALRLGGIQGGTGEELLYGKINPNAILQVLYTDPRALPAMPQGYTMIDAIALADQPLDSLTEDQIAALKGYVRLGGLLIVSGGGDLARLKSQFFAVMLPIEPSGISMTRELTELTQRYRDPLVLTEPTALTDGALKPDAYPLFGNSGGKLPLISARPYGSGTVVFTRFDYLAPEFRGWKGSPALWRDLLRAGNDSISPRDVACASSLGFQGEWARMADALAGKQATSMPPLSTIAIFLGGYIFLLVPASYMFLKRLDRREFAWITAPLLIGGFTVASYIMAQGIKGGMLTVNRVVIFESNANSDQAAGYAQMTLYSPRRTTYDIAMGAPDDPENPYHILSPSEILTADAQSLPGELMVEHDKTTTLRDTLVKLWDKRSFDTPVQENLGGPIKVSAELLNGNNVAVTITNRTRYAIQDGTLIDGDRTVPIGNLAPGETVQRTVQWAASRRYIGSIGLPQSAQNRAAGIDTPDVTGDDEKRLPTTDATRARIREALTQILRQETGSQNNGYNFGGYGDAQPDSGRTANAFAGWFYDPVLDVRVDGQKTAGQEVNLLYVHLPPPQNAPPGLRAATNPFAEAPILPLADEEPPGARKTGIFK